MHSHRHVTHCPNFDFLPFHGRNSRQIVLNHVLLPVVDCSVPFGLLGFVVLVLDVHPRVIFKVSERHLVEPLSEDIVPLRILGCQQILHRLLPTHVSVRNEWLAREDRRGCSYFILVEALCRKLVLRLYLL